MILSRRWSVVGISRFMSPASGTLLLGGGAGAGAGADGAKEVEE